MDKPTMHPTEVMTKEDKINYQKHLTFSFTIKYKLSNNIHIHINSNTLQTNNISGGGDARNTDNFQGNDNHNHQDNHIMNGAEEEERGEERMYHVLEKPGDDDYEDPDKDLEENTAVDYETPVPLKEI